MATLYTLLSRASEYAEELDLITQRIDILSEMARYILDKGTNSAELIIEPHPVNGAMPIIIPLYAPPEISIEEPKEPLQVGFQRFYHLKDLGKEELFLAAVPLETPIIMAVIDRTINRLKHRRDILVKRSRNILKAD